MTAVCETRVNPVIGDTSFGGDGGGRVPIEGVSEKERVARHLVYARAMVAQGRLLLEGVGAKGSDGQDAPSTSDSVAPQGDGEIAAARVRVLARLADYVARGEFPTNGADAAPPHSGAGRPRAPAFIDRATHTPCAVAYLMQGSPRVPVDPSVGGGRETTEISGAELARLVDARHHNGYAADIYAAEPLVRAWAASVGLTALELATIQPTYGYRPPVPRRREAKDPATLVPESPSPTNPSPPTAPRAQVVHHSETLIFRCDSCGDSDLRPPGHFRCTVCADTDCCMTCYHALREGRATPLNRTCVRHEIAHIRTAADATALTERIIKARRDKEAAVEAAMVAAETSKVRKIANAATP
jgi:hypothetical protein